MKPIFRADSPCTRMGAEDSLVHPRLDAWFHPMSIGEPFQTVPTWLTANLLVQLPRGRVTRRRAVLGIPCQAKVLPWLTPCRLESPLPCRRRRPSGPTGRRVLARNG